MLEVKNEDGTWPLETFTYTQDNVSSGLSSLSVYLCIHTVDLESKIK